MFSENWKKLTFKNLEAARAFIFGTNCQRVRKVLVMLAEVFQIIFIQYLSFSS